MKKTFTLKKYINPQIKVGDKIRVFDGSSLTSMKDDEKTVYIVCGYHYLTGTYEILSHIDGEVLEIGIEDKISIGYTEAYLQDIVIQLGNGKFRTASKMVVKVVDNPELVTP